MDFTSTAIWITIMMISFKSQSASEYSCELNVNNCDYEIKVLPKGDNHGNSVPDYKHSRIRRAGYYSSGNMSEIIESKVDRLQNKMTKEMRQLSQRVLRGVRRLDSVITNFVSKHTKSGIRDPTTCPPGFVSVDNWRSCYMFSRFTATWFEARDYCNALDSEMVSLTTLKEHFLVTFLIKNNNEIRSAEAWWTSGQFVSKTKTWMWTSDTELRPFSFIKWAAGEPNESSLQCVMLFSGDNHLWHDQLCTENFNFVCEFETS